MSSYKNISLCVIVILAATVFLSACRAEIKENTTVRKEPTTATDTAYQTSTSAGTGENKTTTYKKEETRTGAATAASAKTEESRSESTAAAPAATTAGQVQFKEWTYWSAAGYKVTYTENPGNEYITKAAAQLGVSANKLSASYNSKGATIFLFSSSVKSEATLIDCFIMFYEKMTIEENIRNDNSTGSNKALADILYKNAKQKEPKDPRAGS